MDSGSTPMAESTTLAESRNVLISSSCSGFCAWGVLEPSSSSSGSDLPAVAAAPCCEDGLGGTGDVASGIPDLGLLICTWPRRGWEGVVGGWSSRTGSVSSSFACDAALGSLAKVGLAHFFRLQELGDMAGMSGWLS